MSSLRPLLTSIPKTRAYFPVTHARNLASVIDSRTGTAVGPFEVFDRKAKRLQKDAAASRDGGERSRTVDYVRDEVADRMMERFMVSLSTLVSP